MIELQVEGMTCGGCANSVKRSIQALDASAAVQVDLANKTVQIDTVATIGQVTAAVADAGYPVTASKEL